MLSSDVCHLTECPSTSGWLDPGSSWHNQRFQSGALRVLSEESRLGVWGTVETKFSRFNVCSTNVHGNMSKVSTPKTP